MLRKGERPTRGAVRAGCGPASLTNGPAEFFLGLFFDMLKLLSLYVICSVYVRNVEKSLYEA